MTDLKKLMDTIESLRQENERLREALAEVVAGYDNSTPQDTEFEWTVWYRKAKAALRNQK